MYVPIIKLEIQDHHARRKIYITNFGGRGDLAPQPLDASSELGSESKKVNEKPTKDRLDANVKISIFLSRFASFVYRVCYQSHTVFTEAF